MKSNWPMKKLGDILEIARGGSPRPIKSYLTKASNGINWVKIGDATASSKYIYQTQEKIKPEGIKKSRLVREGDFLLSNSMSFGRPYIMKTTGCIHDGWLVLHPKGDNIDQDFLYYLLGSPFAYRQFDRLAAGACVRNLNTDLVRKVEIPFPSLPEQKEIVSVLNQVFEKTAKAKENAEKNLQNARELFESYLQSVFTNRGDEWEEKCLKELGIITSSKRIFKREYVKDGVAFYRTKEIKELAHGNDISLKLFISRKRYNEIKSKYGVPKEGDVLLSAVGTIGEIYVVQKNDEFYFKDGNIVWLKDFKSVDRYYLKYALQSFVEQIKMLSRGAAYNALTIEKLNEYKIPIPSIKEQRQIVSKLDLLLAETRKLQEVYQEKLADLEELKKSVLQKAFNGGLVGA